MIKFLFFVLLCFNSFSNSETFEIIKNTAVNIKMMIGNKSRHIFRSIGSGFVIDAEKGYVMTAAHVLSGFQDREDDYDLLGIEFFDGRVVTAKPVLFYYARDIAIVQIIPNNYVKLPLPKEYTATLRSSNDVSVGETIYTYGNPAGMSRIMTKGIVSSMGKRVTMPTPQLYENMLQIDAVIMGGNSGGALFDEYGNVIGLIALSSHDRYGLCVPSSIMIQVWENFVERKVLETPMIGLLVRDSIEKDDERIDFKSTLGVIVREVVKGSPASKHFKGGDYIVSIDGKRTYSDSILRAHLHDKKIGEKYKIEFYRGKELKSVEVTTVNAYFDLRAEDIVLTKQDDDIMKKKIKKKDLQREIFNNLYGTPKIKSSILKRDKKDKVTEYQKKYRETTMKMSNYL